MGRARSSVVCLHSLFTDLEHHPLHLVEPCKAFAPGKHAGARAARWFVSQEELASRGLGGQSN